MKTRIHKSGMKVLAFHKSSFECQIDEALKIQYNRENNILNSKSEYNGSSIPRLGVKLCSKAYTTRQEHEEEEMSEREKSTEEKIRMLRKQLGKKAQRRKYQEKSSAPKRRKLDQGDYTDERKTASSNGNIEKEEKRKIENDRDEATKKRRNKLG